MATMNETPLFKLNNDEVSGRDGVRAFYADLFQGFPDFHIDVTQRHVSDEAVILEVIISVTHTNEWRGIPENLR
jgi:SnoaL-like polyketide cyclase